MSRFLYLNIYSFLLAGAGILALAAPFYLITKWTLVAQIPVALYLLTMSGNLFSAWDSKKKEIEILVKRNKAEFRPDTFETFMKAPCGRLLVRAVLCELEKPDEYKNLLKLRKPFWAEIKSACAPVKSAVYIYEENA